MTERLYYRDSGLLEFDAIAVGYAGDERHVVLDRTAFYPTSGGQPHDTGALGPVRVLDVIDQGHRIVHVVDGSLALGVVHGEVDAARRWDHMQQHTAQHLLSALAADRNGWETASVHFGPEHSTIEFDTVAVPDSQLAELELAANDIVAQARSVQIAFEDAAIAAGLRKSPARAGEIRVITIAGIDRSACGGTHVSRTSEIGPILLLGTEKVRGHTRIGFLAGARVLARVRASDAAVARVATVLGCSVTELGALVPARQQELKAARDQLARFEQEVAGSRVRAVYDAKLPGADGMHRLVHRATEESPSLLRLMAQFAATLERAVFVAIAPTPPTIYLGASLDTGIDAGAVLKAALTSVGGRGGGSPRAAQGTAPTADALEHVAANLSSWET